jgi:phosphoribosyl-ATP pyrophosphohydrolase
MTLRTPARSTAASGAGQLLMNAFGKQTIARLVTLKWLRMTTMQITNEVVEAFGNAAREQFGLPPATYDEMVKASPDVVANIRRNLEAALPLIRAGVDERHGFGVLVASAYAEADKAMRKFPQPNYVISKVAEEAGEVVKAAIHCAENRETADNVAGEMKQLIAMLYRLWVEGDQVHGLPPVAAIRALKGGEA